MTIRRLTPEQARALVTLARAVLERITEALRPLVDAVRALGRSLGEALHRMRRHAQQARAARTLPDRPVWQSPYGPPQPRH